MTTPLPDNSKPAVAVRSAVLIGKDVGSEINVRSEPTTESNSLTYGLVGDQVQVMSEARGRDGYTWYRVQFESGDEGWIRGDLVKLSAISNVQAKPDGSKAVTGPDN
ncbi:MAG: SH3 domain-containing protein [Cyanothece sp. SIO1E1]|nr:SH3 domain-containing protein [Cyanothece sp. SIO1E1]